MDTGELATWGAAASAAATAVFAFFKWFVGLSESRWERFRAAELESNERFITEKDERIEELKAAASTERSKNNVLYSHISNLEAALGAAGLPVPERPRFEVR